MEPVLKSWPQKKRNIWFGPILIVGAVLGFLFSAVPTAEFVLGLLVGPIVGTAAAYALVGWPHLTTKSGKPLITARVKPWLFFLVFPIAVVAIYILLGVFLTSVLPPAYLAWVSLTLAAIGAFATGWLVTGLPPVASTLQAQWARIPTHVRPWLFFPLLAVLGAVLYFVVGVIVTETAIPLSWYPFVVLPTALVLAAVLAYVLVGFPQPAKPVTEYLPEVPGRLRPPVFIATFLVLGVPLSYVAGIGMNLVPGLPENALLAFAFLLGYAMALGVAAAVWGTPRSWAARFPDYTPGLPEGARVALFLPVVVVVAVVGAFVTNMIGLDLYWGLLTGSMVGVLIALKVTGAFKRLRELRGDAETLLPELPDKVKPLVLFPVWFLVGGLVTVSATYALPDATAWNTAAGAAIGLVVALILVEEPTFREMLADRRERRTRRAEWKRKRAEALKDARGSR